MVRRCRDRGQIRAAGLVAAGRGEAGQSEPSRRGPERFAEQPDGRGRAVLNRDEYAIHGTNQPSSIGTFASYGCIRMLNEDMMDLFQRVTVGTRVMVVR